MIFGARVIISELQPRGGGGEGVQLIFFQGPDVRVGRDLTDAAHFRREKKKMASVWYP